MARRKGGARRKTRHKLMKPLGQHGKTSLRRFFADIPEGTPVTLLYDSAIQKGTYHPRFYGLPATVLGKQGRCYLLSVNDQGKQKRLIVHPVHLTVQERKDAK